MMNIELDSVVVQGREQICAEVDGEVVMMSITQGHYYGLDSIGGRVWELIAEPCSVRELCDRLVVEFAVDRAVCEADVLRFLNDMVAQKLIDTRTD